MPQMAKGKVSKTKIKLEIVSRIMTQAKTMLSIGEKLQW